MYKEEVKIWNNKTKEMLFLTEVNSEKIQNWYRTNPNDIAVINNTNKISKSKNQIYEGDILLINHRDKLIDFIYVVEKQENTWVIRSFYNDIYELNYDIALKSEIISNIYENQNLIPNNFQFKT